MLRRAGGTGAILLATLALGSCVGSVSFSEFDEEVRARGGGIGQELILEGVDAVAGELDLDRPEDVELVAVSASPGLVTLQVRVPGADAVDLYWYGSSGHYGGRGLRGPEPHQITAGEPPLDRQVFGPGQAGLDRIDAMVGTAFAEAGLEAPYATTLTATRPAPEAPPVVKVTVTDDRSTYTVRLAADGSVVGVDQR